MKKEVQKSRRRKHSPEFKDQVLLRAEQDGVAQTAKDLGIKESQIYAWRAKKKLSGTSLENQKLQQLEMNRLRREVERLSMENDFLKKGRGVLCQGLKARYAMIKKYKDQFPIRFMCRLLCVSKSGYYAWLKDKPSKCELENKSW